MSDTCQRWPRIWRRCSVAPALLPQSEQTSTDKQARDLMAQSRFIRWFRELGITDVPLVGGKNASLGEMYCELMSKGIRIPNGFCGDGRGLLACLTGWWPRSADPHHPGRSRYAGSRQPRRATIQSLPASWSPVVLIASRSTPTPCSKRHRRLLRWSSQYVREKRRHKKGELCGFRC